MSKKELTPKQDLFCREYLVDLNATQAAIRAGYSEKRADVTGARLLVNVRVHARIEQLKEERARKTAITAEWIISELQRVFSRCIVPVEIEKWDKELKQMVGTGEFRFDSTGANRSLELLGKHIGMFEKKDQADLDKEAEKLEAMKAIAEKM